MFPPASTLQISRVLPWLTTAAVALLLASGPATAAAAPECPQGNLLRDLKPFAEAGVVEPAAVTDGIVANEGSHWNTSRTAFFEREDAHLTYDLGRALSIRALLLQADGNDAYRVGGSLDGETFRDAWTAAADPRVGMRLRAARDLDVLARYLRIEPARGDGSFSVGELQAFCRVPSPWPVSPEVRPATPRDPDPRRALARRKMAIGALAALALIGLARRGRRGSRAGSHGLRPSLLTLGGATGTLAVAAWATLGWLGVVFAAVSMGSWILFCVDARERSARALVPALTLLALAGELLWAWSRALTGPFGVLAALSCAISALVMLLLQRRGKVRHARWSERIPLGAILVAGILSWTNFGAFHGARATHLWEMFHYYVGSKYFFENGYTGLYDCALLAEIEDGRSAEMPLRSVRDLKTNELGPVSRILPASPSCRRAFTEARWRAFRQDIRVFRALMGADAYRRALMDHGYNATPAWTGLGRLFSNQGWRTKIPAEGEVLSPANLRGRAPEDRRRIRLDFARAADALQTRLQRLGLLDAAFYLGIFALIFWAFGLRACAVAALVWGVGYPWDYHFTGGGFGRAAWMFAATAGVCLLKKDRPALAGASLATSAMLRVFPVLLLGGVAFQVIHGLVRHRTVAPAHRRFLAGSAACALVWLAIGAASQGPGVYRDFWNNSLKHRATHLTNDMGLPTLFSYHPQRVGRHTVDDGLDDPWAAWKEGRQETLRQRLPLFYAAALALTLLLAWISPRVAAWEATAMSVVLILALLKLTGYYYLFVLLLAPAASHRSARSLLLIAAAVASQWLYLRIPWYDELYTAETALVGGLMLCLLLATAWSAGRGQWVSGRPASTDADGLAGTGPRDRRPATRRGRDPSG